MNKIEEKRLKKIIKQYILEAIEEDYPFAYPDDRNAPHNHNSEVFTNVPSDSTTVDVNNTTGDDVGGALSNPSWWNRHYGFNGYGV